MPDFKMEKGRYEEAVEAAKHMMNKGMGSIEIMEATSLNEEDLRKIQKKQRQREND